MLLGSELRTIQDCTKGVPCADPIFGPTQSNEYCSSSSYAINPYWAMYVFFNDISNFGASFKSGSHYVRAVVLRLVYRVHFSQGF
jgi:hypothetical protein